MMDDLLKQIHFFAKKILKERGSLSPVAFLVRDGEFSSPMLLDFSNDHKKYTSCIEIGLTAQKINSDRIILVNDIAMRTVNSLEEAEYIKDNYDHESPLSYPESMRIDGILFIDINISTNKRSIYLQKYKKSSQDLVFLDLDHQTNFDGALIQAVMKGLNYKG